MKRCLLGMTALVLCAANTSPQGPVPGWTPVHVARLEVDAIVASRQTPTIDLPSRLPVYVAYVTAATDASGALVITPDIYGRDGQISIAGDAHGAHELSAHAVVLVVKDMLDPRPDL